MEPLSLRLRRLVAFIFFGLCAVVVFVAVVYASGYRLDFDELILESTGGIYVSVPASGGEVFLNDVVVGTSGFLTRSFFIDTLSPGNYTVRVSVPGYREWSKNLIVERALVTDTVAFLVPQNLSLLSVIATTSAATTTRAVTRSEYQSIRELFLLATTTALIATTTPGSVDSVELVLRNGNVYVRWNRDLTRAPSAFCVTPGACVVEISVENEQVETTRAELYRDGVVYQTMSGIFFSEIDVKQPRVLVTLYTGPAEFRIENGEVFIKDGDELFAISGWEP